MFSVKSIKNIINLGPIKICNYKENDTIEYITYNFEAINETKFLLLGLYKEHFFLDEEIDVSTFWIDNYLENK